MKLTPVKGTNEYLPQEALLRDYMENTIADIYRQNGFERIYTPIIEDLENLENSEGGENLSLIFKVLKRGEKLTKAIEAGNLDSLADIGLRYDLTLPLARFYANNRSKLFTPFKCIQIDRAYRAENPQKGRLREFKQCDIDILGSDSADCETEIILVTAKALASLGLGDITVKINDRRLLNAALLHAGFKDSDLPGVCVILDKYDKIGLEGVINLLFEKGFGGEVERLEEIIEKSCSLEFLGGIPGCEDAALQLGEIISSVTELSNIKVEFDFTLVRGQGYYTGTVFEIKSNKYQSSIAGGGRYDNMIGKFIGEKIPAVGFSIGFERIFDILSETGFAMPGVKKRLVLFYDEGKFAKAYKKAEELGGEYRVTLRKKVKKLGKVIKKYEDAGFEEHLILD
ncbi:MAG: histidine--tRNA ligase [Clostridiales bacterium]|jgi:histidyl-tRNA synthetase|nr:histidine--tRNA ligase [Clostridiales bacterium]